MIRGNVIAIFACMLALTACVTSSPDVLLSSVSTEPVGEAQKTGQFPVIGQVPTGQTTQLTPTEKAATKTDLAKATQKGDAQAAQNSEAIYRKEVADLQKLALDAQKKRLAEIEAGAANE